MIWQDLLIDRWPDADQLLRAAERAFGAPASTIAIVDDVEQLVTAPQARILLERVRQRADFPLQLTVIIRDDELAARFAGFDGALRVARDLARTLGATVVFAEGPLGPSEWVRVRPGGALDIVSLDTDDSAEGDAFSVVAERPYAMSHPERDRRTA